MDRRPVTGIPETFEPVVALEDCFDAVYGLELLDDGNRDGVVRGRTAIRDDLRQQFGLLHGRGHLNQTAAVRHRGRTRWLWEVESRDDDDRLCAVTIVNIAVRDRRRG